MRRFFRDIDRGTRTIDTVAVTVTELVGAGGLRTFEAFLSDGTDLTGPDCFDAAPTDRQLRELLDEHRGLWRCTGCGTTVAVTERDLVADHLRDCYPPAGGQQ